MPKPFAMLTRLRSLPENEVLTTDENGMSQSDTAVACKFTCLSFTNSQPFHTLARKLKGKSIILVQKEACHHSESRSTVRQMVSPRSCEDSSCLLIIFLRWLLRCLDDFSGGNVHDGCALLKSSSRYLFMLKLMSSRLDMLMAAMTWFSKVKVCIVSLLVSDVCIYHLVPYFHFTRISTSDTSQQSKESFSVPSFVRLGLANRPSSIHHWRLAYVISSW